jgi:hypothetical protein
MAQNNVDVSIDSRNTLKVRNIELGSEYIIISFVEHPEESWARSLPKYDVQDILHKRLSRREALLRFA